MDFDETRIFYSHQALQKECSEEDNPQQAEVNDNDDEQVDLNAVRRHFREFLSESTCETTMIGMIGIFEGTHALLQHLRKHRKLQTRTSQILIQGEASPNASPRRQ
jgi:hypothetical protein